jgi:diaminohydroxyphosphoribosylaminopyrimidine deaminase/5-amino-6-(5-phosphoribosylamino)uracil reductase
MMQADEKLMIQALKLAARGLGAVEPNPAVGCVIYKGTQVAGKGWHKKFGQPHAEINALEDCKNLGVDPKGSTMYVTLEPCCHEGKTPPCTQAIINAKVAKVYVAMLDPSEKVAGKGIAQLRDAGIDVEVGMCESQARLLNAAFIKYALTASPWIIAKWAQSIDGAVAWAPEQQDKRWISNELSRKAVHDLRRRCQAIMVGINTVLGDDPLLTPRPPKGRKPLRVVLDNQLRIPLDCQLIKTAKKCPVLIAAWHGAVVANPDKAKAIRKAGAEIYEYGDTGGRSNLHLIIKHLGAIGIQQVLLEGGPTVTGSFFHEQLIDEVCIFIAPDIFGQAGGANISEKLRLLTTREKLSHCRVTNFDDDLCINGLLDNSANLICLKQT